MPFPTIVETIKVVSKQLGGGNRTKTYIEGNAAQSYVIQQLVHDGYYTKEVISRGEKGERLAYISPSIQNAQVLFPRKGCELLISQTVNFGLEDHDDLSDALVILVNEVLKDSSGYEPFSRLPTPPTDDENPKLDVDGKIRGYRPITAGLMKKIF